MDLDPLDAFSKLVEVNLANIGSVVDYPSWMREVVQNLAFIKAFLMDPPHQFVEDGRLRELKSLASELGSIISTFNLKKMDYLYMARQLISPLMSLAQWMDPARRIYEERPKPSRTNYPKISQLFFVDHLVEKLKQLLEVQADSIGPLKHFILRVQWELQDMQLHNKAADLVESVTNLAYEVEYAIDSFLVKDIPIWLCMLWLSDILKEFEQLRGGRDKMRFVDTRSIITSIISRDQKKLNIIPFLLKDTEIEEMMIEVFDSYPVVLAFDIRTWSLVSSYKQRKKEVLHELLDNVSYLQDDNELDEKGHTINSKEDELENYLRELLKNKKYLVILEGVDDVDAFSDMRRVLPDDRNGSVVLLTTPSIQVAVHCCDVSQNGISSMVPRNYISTSRKNMPTTDDIVVGFKEERQSLLEILLRYHHEFHVIAIVGMGGQGKTTLAKTLYNDPLVDNYFDVRAWCCMSQVYEKRELLLKLLSNVIQLSDTYNRETDDELTVRLRRHLKARRFLIFVDDIWDIDSWNDLRICFPNNNNGSKILFTTRISDLTLRANSNSILQPLSPLESWELLKKKVFGEESCPIELLGVGKEIAKNCKGLPLSIVLVAGLVAKMEKKVDHWEHIAKTLSPHLLRQHLGEYVIELSYKHLPDPLKPCFLYFGTFLENREIPVSKLIQLWIAERFIEYTNSKSSEDVAEDYLMDLIGRGLVIGTQEKSIGGVKSCRVHDLLREFCLMKATEENFLQQVIEYDKHFPPSNDDLGYGLDSHGSYSSTPITYHLHRLSIHSKRNHFITLKPSGPLVQSLMLFCNSDMRLSHLYDISFIFYNFKLLKILVLENINIGDSFKVIDVLVLLRHLEVRGSINFIPSSLANLSNLEYFLIKGLSDQVIKVPNSIWDMEKLKYVHIDDAAAFDLDPCNLEESSLVDNLQSFSTPSLAYGDDMEKILKKLRGIRKLKCIFLDSWDDIRNCNQFPELGFLNELVSLKVFYNGKGQYPSELNFPSNLKKLTLSNFRLPRNLYSQLATLHNLEVLKLLGNTFEGETWEMEKQEEFPKLKFLKLETLDFVTWIACAENFPCLKHLILSKCKQLQKIPLGIGEISTLEMIDVIWCSRDVATSARNIQDKYGERLNVNILESERIASDVALPGNQWRHGEYGIDDDDVRNSTSSSSSSALILRDLNAGILMCRPSITEAPSFDQAGMFDAMWQMNLRSREQMDSGPYPLREGAPDCMYYIRTGLCKFGATCLFNHPPNRKLAIATAAMKGEYPERIGEPECQYYLRTGWCKFGATCKFHHPREKGGIAGRVSLNVLGYPLRPNEAPCAYYLRTGQCKFGITCKFHHPQPSNMMTSLHSSPVYPPVQSPTTPGQPSYRAPSIASSSYAPIYAQVGAYSSHRNEAANMGSQGPYSSYGSGSLPVGDYALQSERVFPERPGEPECQFYMKTGDCKFGAFCKFHHPKERLIPAPTSVLGPMGLPLRPGEPLCTYYSLYGVCKFGPSCKFDHPMFIYNLSAPSTDAPAVKRFLGPSSATGGPALSWDGLVESGSTKPRRHSLTDARSMSFGDKKIEPEG